MGGIKKNRKLKLLSPDPGSVTAEAVGQSSFVLYGLAIHYLFVYSVSQNKHSLSSL